VNKIIPRHFNEQQNTNLNRIHNNHLHIKDNTDAGA